MLLIPAVKYAIAFSVSGFVYDFTILGVAARPSAIIAKAIARLGIFVTCHKIKPSSDNVPQIISSLPIFHSDFLLIKDASKIIIGLNPAMNVVKDIKPTCCLS